MKKLGRSILVLFFLTFFSGNLPAQEVVDKIMATVSDGVRTEIITYSDLMWQIALEPDTSLNPPNEDDLTRALQLMINQRLIVLEAKRLPTVVVKEEELQSELKRVLSYFSNSADFVKRLQRVGFESVQDENFRKILEQRASIEKYLDFRFRSFVVITPEEENRYYRDVYAPQFRKANPGLLMPTLNEVRKEINQLLTERKISSDIERFLDNAKSRAEIVVFEF